MVRQSGARRRSARPFQLPPPLPVRLPPVFRSRLTVVLIFTMHDSDIVTSEGVLNAGACGYLLKSGAEAV